ncbi:MAG: hypothetical protein ACI4PO_05360 [Faecousia sp.]
MDMLKKIFPYSFGAADVKALVIKVILYLVVSAVGGWILSLLPLIGGILAWVLGLYCTVGWILAILDYLKVLK